MGNFNNYNSITVLGRLTRDPEMRTTDSGTQVCNFSVAQNDQVKKDGKYEKSTIFYECAAFGKLAEFMAKFAKKGRECLVIGHFRQELYTTKNGEARTKLVITANDTALCGTDNSEAVAESPSGTTPYATSIKEEVELPWPSN